MVEVAIKFKSDQATEQSALVILVPESSVVGLVKRCDLE